MNIAAVTTIKRVERISFSWSHLIELTIVFIGIYRKSFSKALCIHILSVIVFTANS